MESSELKTLFLNAIQESDLDLVECIVSCGADIDGDLEEGGNPLFWAICSEFVEII